MFFYASQGSCFSFCQENNTCLLKNRTLIIKKEIKKIKILENKLELGEFIDNFFLILGEILGTEKHNLCKIRFSEVFLADKAPVNFLRWRFANTF